ncbi:hypothetical protein D3C85_1198630 [compost metagenome]
MDGGAGAFQLRPTQGAAGHGWRAVPRWNDRLERIAAQTEIDRAVGGGPVGVDPRRPVQFSTIEGEGDGIERQYAVLEVGAEAHLPDVEGVGLHRTGAIGQGAVHGAKPFCPQRGVWQELAGLAGGRDSAAAGDPRTGAQDCREVINVQRA